MEDSKDLKNDIVPENDVMEVNNINFDSKEKNNSKTLIIIIVILCVIIACLLGFIIFNNLNNSDTKIIDKIDNSEKEDSSSNNDNSGTENNDSNKNDESYIDVDKEEIDDTNKEENVPRIEVADLNFANDKLQRFMKLSGSCGSGAYAYFTTKKIVAADISNELALKTVAFAFLDQNVSILADDFSKKVAEYFGEDYDYQHFTYEGCIDHVYNSTTNAYEHVAIACGCTSFPNSATMYNVSSAYYEGDFLVLNIKVLFPGNEFIPDQYHKYYSDAALTKEVEGLVFNDVQSMEAYPLSIDSNYEKGGTFKFVMKKVRDDVYSFVSSEPVA